MNPNTPNIPTSNDGCLGYLIQLFLFLVGVLVFTLSWNQAFGQLTHVWFSYFRTAALFFCVYCVSRVAATAFMNALPSVWFTYLVGSLDKDMPNLRNKNKDQE